MQDRKGVLWRARGWDWALDRECYTLAQVANLLRTLLSKEKAAAYAGEVWTRVRLCGYSAGRPLC